MFRTEILISGKLCPGILSRKRKRIEGILFRNVWISRYLKFFSNFDVFVSFQISKFHKFFFSSKVLKISKSLFRFIIFIVFEFLSIRTFSIKVFRCK